MACSRQKFFPLFVDRLRRPLGSLLQFALGSWFVTSFGCWFHWGWAVQPGNRCLAGNLIFSKDVKESAGSVLQMSCRLTLLCFWTMKQLSFAKKFCSGSPDTGVTFFNFWFFEHSGLIKFWFGDKLFYWTINVNVALHNSDSQMFLCAVVWMIYRCRIYQNINSMSVLYFSPS